MVGLAAIPACSILTDLNSARSMLTIRSFLPEDREAVVQLWQECGLVRPQNDPRKDIKRKLMMGNDLFLVGLAEEKM